jgi:hypothetical protein
VLIFSAAKLQRGVQRPTHVGSSQHTKIYRAPVVDCLGLPIYHRRLFPEHSVQHHAPIVATGHCGHHEQRLVGSIINIHRGQNLSSSLEAVHTLGGWEHARALAVGSSGGAVCSSGTGSRLLAQCVSARSNGTAPGRGVAYLPRGRSTSIQYHIYYQKRKSQSTNSSDQSTLMLRRRYVLGVHVLGIGT